MGVELRHQQQQMEEDAANVSDWELVYHVRDALLAVQSGDFGGYRDLVGVLRHCERLSPDEVALLVTSLKALSGAVSYIDNIHHDSLLNSIFDMSMWNYGPDVMDALIELVVSLAASNGKYIDSCLDMLVNNFVPPIYLVDFVKQPRGQARKDQVLTRVHTALKDIADLVPLAASRLSSIVVHKMPMTFKKDLEKDRLKYRTHVYVENMLRLESGAIREFVGSRMLMAVVDVLIELDVAIGWDEILRDDPSKGVFEIELEDVDEDDGVEMDDVELPRSLSHKILGKNVIADLLDSLMVQTFEHLDFCASNNRLNEVFETLLDSFMLTVLNTYKSKFAQFVMFYACALNPEHCAVKFAGALADRFLSGQNPLTRMSAVAYLASYLARGKFLSPAFVANVLKRLVEWCLEYCKAHNGDMKPKAHRVFYSGCQAIMYVLCFRMRSMMDAPLLKSQLLQMRIETILNHNLKPLKVCLPSIVEEFSKQAKAAHLFTLPEQYISNDSMESDLSRDFGGLERLDMFFPFDPLLLEKSDRNFIRPSFVYWKHVRTTYSDPEDEDSSDEDVDEDLGIENGDDAFDIDEFDCAMNKMSITPKNSSMYRLGGVQDQMRMPSKIRPSTSPESL